MFRNRWGRGVLCGCRRGRGDRRWCERGRRRGYRSGRGARRKWQITDIPNAAESYSLAGVSCATATHCVAVGSIAVGTTFHTLIETFDGTKWTETPSPVAGTVMYFLTGVSCLSPSSCVAVGELLGNAGSSRR